MVTKDVHGRGSFTLEPCRFDIYVPHYRTCLKFGTLYIKIGNTNRVVEIKQNSTPKLAQINSSFSFPYFAVSPLHSISSLCRVHEVTGSILGKRTVP